MVRIFFLVGCCSFLIWACNDIAEKSPDDSPAKLFERMPANQTGIEFINKVTSDEDFNVFRYRNFYNGGGVGIGDLNNDGLPDVFLVSNMGDNKLFLNKGDWKFEDITATAGVKGSKSWSTGVSFVDVNADGFLDIYVCNAGDVEGKNQQNELFINNGDLTFTEQAASYGLDDPGFTTHAAFFDYDKDGDLDCYILNNSFRPVASLGFRNLRHVRDPLGGHKLYRNDNGRFVDVSEQAGIYGSVIGFGLGVTVGDVNDDNWPDIYVSNDFYERDYLYINRGDGTFSEELEDYMGHISMFSMGADMADLNNDGLPEIYSTDMLPEDDARLKTVSAFETYDVYQLRLKNGYYHQFMRNMLHRNNGDGTFSEIGALAGVDATDWSWAALIADFDNDAYKEIFVSNGIYKDLTDQDFIEYLGSSEQMQAVVQGKKVSLASFVDKMPSPTLSNYMFRRKEDWRYENVSAAWGLDEPSFSNGSAYGDLDNDGDLDLIINNVNQEVFVYRNLANEKTNNNYLAIALQGTEKNTFGLGTNVKAIVDGQVLTVEQMPMRGFQSSMDYKMLIGLGQYAVVDSLVVTWWDNRRQVLTNVKANQEITVSHADASGPVQTVSKKRLSTIFRPLNVAAPVHEENEFNEFDRDRLQYHMLSTLGPAFARGDLNGDGREDFYVGGSAGNAGRIYLAGNNGFVALPELPGDKDADDVDALFFDADGDGDLDLYVVTGGTENTGQSLALRDKLYINEGLNSSKQPKFVLATDRLPAFYHSGSCIRAVDIDGDGDLDLFVGTRVMPTYYGMPCDQRILINNGEGKFTDETDTVAPELRELGMVTDAVWADYDGDGDPDLIVVGEWMPVTIFRNDSSRLTKTTDIPGTEDSEGWWTRIVAADLNEDGKIDFVLGNWGVNSKFRPTPENPVRLHVADFDDNGSYEPIFTFVDDKGEYPMALRPDLLKQMSSLKKKFVYYKDYAGKSMEEIFDEKVRKRAKVWRYCMPYTSVMMNQGDSFDIIPLPVEAQVAPVYGIAVEDINGDGAVDIVLGGNLFAVKPEIGRLDALYGLTLLGDNKGTFKPVSPVRSGLKVTGEVRHIEVLKDRNQRRLVVVRNNDTMLFYDF